MTYINTYTKAMNNPVFGAAHTLLHLSAAPRRVMTAEGSVMDQQREKTLSMDDLYGEGKAYPEPYNAGTALHHRVLL